VEDSEQFTIEPDVTCLVGKNEGGKTAVQQAIYRCNPVEASARFDEVVDFPARLTKQRKQWGDRERIPVIKLTFRFEADEIEAIQEDLGAGALQSPEFTVTRGYRDPTRF
jgi:predicted ATP-dependent endonuclease of OLD family